jgi:aldose 1-epimerase
MGSAAIMVDMPTTFELRHAALHVSLRPDLGGCIEGLWLHGIPVLRSSAPGTLANVRLSACYPLVPYSNRIAQAQLLWNGTNHPLLKNFGGEAHAIHGVGWQKPWQMPEADSSFAKMSLEHRPDASWPFAFDATQIFRVSDHTLEVTLSITNQSPGAAPVGLGWHPYFTKRADTRVEFAAAGLWDMGGDKLPTQRTDSTGLHRDCAQLMIDNCFEGWSGSAVVRDAQLTTRLESDLRRLVVYTEPPQDFIAIEPVSHVNNAINQAGKHQALGVVVLAAGQSWQARMRIHTERTSA